MTKEEFIDGYIKRSNVPDMAKTDFGLTWGGKKMFALPCNCSYEDCKGWAMVAEQFVDHHMEFYSP